MLKEESLISHADVQAGLIVVGALQFTQTIIGLDGNLWYGVIVQTNSDAMYIGIVEHILVLGRDIAIVVLVTSEDIKFLFIEA
jgi:hypothetical protein